MNRKKYVNLGGKECYEPDELPTALSRDVDGKDTTNIQIIPNEGVIFFGLCSGHKTGNQW